MQVGAGVGSGTGEGMGSGLCMIEKSRPEGVSGSNVICSVAAPC